METGGSNGNHDIGKLFFDGSEEVFDVVVDPLTDFKVLELNGEPSPQQSFNLPTTLSRLHSASEGTPQDSPLESSPFLDSSSQLLSEGADEAVSLPSKSSHPGRTLFSIFGMKRR